MKSAAKTYFSIAYFFINHTIERNYGAMRGISIVQKPFYREFRPMRGLPVSWTLIFDTYDTS